MASKQSAAELLGVVPPVSQRASSIVTTLRDRLVKSISDAFSAERTAIAKNDDETMRTLGHLELATAIGNRAVELQKQETALLKEVNSQAVFDEAKAWVERYIEGGDENAGDLPSLLLLAGKSQAMNSLVQTSPKDYDEFVRRQLVDDAKIIQGRLAKNADQQDGPWSEPNSPEQWRKTFGNVSVDTIKRWFKSQKIRNKKLSTKSYCIHVDDLPK